MKYFVTLKKLSIHFSKMVWGQISVKISRFRLKFRKIRSLELITIAEIKILK